MRRKSYLCTQIYYYEKNNNCVIGFIGIDGLYFL